MTSPDPAAPQPVGISPRAVDHYDLTRTQQQIWTSQRLEPGTPVANMGKRHRIAGAIDPDRFVSAVHDVIVASDALRTVIVDERDGSIGRVLASPPQRTQVVDLEVSELDDWCRSRIDRAIDATVCSYDSVLLRHDDDDWTWWLDLHHVVTDAAGSAAVFRATSERYEALASGETPGAIELPSFVEHIAGIEAAATSERGASRRAARLAEWDRRTAGSAPPPLNPFGVRSPRTSSSVRLPLEVDLDAMRVAFDGPYRTLTSELSTLAVLASAAAVVMQRLDGRDTCSVGVPVHHRSGRTAPNVIGPLMELYPLEVSIADDDTFESVVQRTLTQVLDVLGRARPGESPVGDYEIVVNVVTGTYGDFAGMPTVTTWERSTHVDPAHPLRLHAFDYSESKGSESKGSESKGSESKGSESKGSESKASEPGALEGSLRFEVDISAMLADDEAAHRLSQHLSAAVSTALSQPGSPLVSFDMVTPPEIEWLAALNAATTGDRHDVIPVTDQVSQSLAERGDDIVALSRSEQVTASEFDDRTQRTVSWLRSLGVAHGDRVGVRLSRSIDVLVAIQAVHRCGAAFVMLDPDDPVARHEAVATDAELCLIIDTIAPALARDLRPEHDPMPVEIRLDDLAYVLYTSGSTGVPKGVPISHRGLADYLRFAVESYVDPDLDPPVVALHSSLVFDLTITSLFLSFLAGGQVVVVDGDPVDALAQIAVDDRITLLKATPSQLDLLARLTESPRPLRTVVVGGEAFRRPTAAAFVDACAPGVRIFNEYGPTEAVVGCMIHEWDPSIDVGPDVPIGHAAPGCEVAVLDVVGRPSAPGSWGELYVRRPGMATAYLNRPELSAQRFVDLRDIPGALEDSGRGPWYRTGDRVRVERSGVATYGGRMDDQLKVNGIRLEPGEVEAVLVDHLRVASAIVRQWTPADRAASRVERCVRCGLGGDVPGVTLDDAGVCSTCRQFVAVAPQADAWFRDGADLDERLAEARRRSTGAYDCLHLLSGGKDSSYALYQLVERGWRVHALTLDNGFISDGAKENIRRSVADLGITHEFATTDAMNAIFRDSLDRYSNVCQGCYKTIYTLAVARAKAMGIPTIVTGLSRGQFFETRLIPAQFAEGRFDPDAIDATVLEARKVYHQTPDAVTKLLPEQAVFGPRPDGGSVLDEIEFVDFYRYVDVDLAELYRYLEDNAPWVRPADTGRSTNCLINVAGIQVHRAERGYHNYAEPYSWDVRLGHKTRDEALEELDDEVDEGEVARLLGDVAYEVKHVQVLTAWYQSVDGADIDPAELRRHARDRLPDHAVPVAFVRVDEMPMAASAKVDVAALPAPTRLHRSGHDVVTADTVTQRVVCDIWADVLQLEQVGITDDFFDLGGDSLAALEVVATLADRFDVELPDAAVFRHRTAAELADLVDGAIGNEVAVIPPLPTGQPLPLSAGEEAMLFEYRMDPDNTRYNITRLYTVAEPVDLDRLRQAVADVVMAHQPLHHSYGADRSPLDPSVAVSFDHVEAADHAGFRAFAMGQRRVPFDLDAGPLVRVHVATVNGDVAVLIGMHHITIDAVTFDLFWEQIAERYGDDVAGALPELANTYAEHATWQRGMIDAHGAYWRAERTTAGHEAGRLALAAPHPAEPDGYLNRSIDLVPADLQGGPASTPFVAALTAAAATVSRFSGSHTVELGISMSVKDHAAAAPLVGYHLNTLPIRLDVGADATHRSVAAEANERVALAIEHRTYPFASIVRDARAAGHAVPDVSCMLAYQTLADTGSGALAGSHEILASGTSIADVTFYIQERIDGIGLGVEYRGDTIGAADAERLLDTFGAILLGAARSPDARFVDLVPIDGDDIVGDELGHATPVLAALVAHASAQPGAVAVRDSDGRSLTYAELVSAAMGLADDLTALDAWSADRARRFVGVAVRRGVDVVIAAIGAQFAGAAYVPLDPGAPAQRLGQIIGAAQPDVIVTDPITIADAIEGVFADALVLRPDRRMDPTAVSRAQDVVAGLDEDGDAYVIFTSGSTAAPRGVVVSHANLAASTAARRGVYPGPPERFLMTSSIGFDSSIVGLFWPLATGGTVVLPNDDVVGDVDRLAALIARERVTHLLMVPSLYGALLERGGRTQLGGLDVAIVAGETCSAAVVRAHLHELPDVGLVNEYGPTEATVWATAQHLTEPEASVPIGRPIPGVTVSVVDTSLRPVPVGVAGELLIAGPTITAGYLDDAEQTAAQFVAIDGRRWYRTGDVARADGHGVLRFLGRIDDQLNVGGVRLEPAEVETAIAALPDIAAVVVVASSSGRARLIAHVEMRSGVSLDESAVRRRLAEIVPVTHVPARVIAHRRLPRTSHGKIDRRAAAQLPTDVGARSVSTVAPSNVTLELVMSAWSDALGRSDLRSDSDYFAVGGDSLAAVEIVTIIGDRIGREVPIASLLAGRTPAGLAALVGGAELDESRAGTVQASTDEQLVVFRAGDPTGPLVVMTTGWDDVFGYQALARALPAEATVLALSTAAARTDGAIISTVDALAVAFCETLRRSQWADADRPITLIGWSTGGVVAYDAAQRLSDGGLDVRRIILVDTYFPGAERHMWANRWSKYKSLLNPSAFGELVREAKLTVRRRARSVAAGLGRRLLAWSGSPLPEAPKTTSVGGVPFDAYRYRPGPTDIDVVMYAASATNRDRTVNGWIGVAPHLEVVPIEGRHRGYDSIMNADRVGTIAADLANRLP